LFEVVYSLYVISCAHLMVEYYSSLFKISEEPLNSIPLVQAFLEPTYTMGNGARSPQYR